MKVEKKEMKKQVETGKENVDLRKEKKREEKGISHGLNEGRYTG